MTLFHEIYGRYFRIAAKILEKPQITAQEIYAITEKDGFRESVLFLPQKLIPQADGSDWGLLRFSEKSGVFTPIVQHKPRMPVTMLQKRWLKAKLSDPRFCLFLDEKTNQALSEKLRDVEPLFLPEWFHAHDRFSDGDPFQDAGYQANFRIILQAIQTGEILRIRYVSGKGEEIELSFLPLFLEYSGKNDKFRLCCTRRKGDTTKNGLVNLGRIRQITPTGKYLLPQRRMQPEIYFNARKCSVSITVSVKPERNATERFMTEFAAYEKHTVRDLETGICTVQLWYDRQDETELLIRLLSFGPVLEILAPPDFREKAAARVRMQMQLLKEDLQWEKGSLRDD